MKDNKRWLYAAIAMVLFNIFTFELINTKIGTPIIVKTFIDNYIPLVPPFIVIYHIFMPLIVIIGLYLYKKGETTNLKNYVISLWMSQIFAYIIFFFFQTDIPRADLTLLPNSIFKTLLEITYKVDNHYAGCPSLHVANMTILFMILLKVNIKKEYKIPILVLTFLIAISTLLVKQHMFLDLVGGFIHGLIFYYVGRKISQIEK